MDFFESQQVARIKTRVLILYLLGAVVVTVLALYLFLAVTIIIGTRFPAIRSYLQILKWVAGVTLVVIGLGSLYKIVQLRAGGAVVARMLGGRPVNPNTREFDERVLLNVVEEMAIATGTTAPPVFLLDDEPAINAFAAGFTPNDAMIAVTRGSIKRLSRDELQGIVAHEFSHILNGDTRLNIRLIGMLHGILVVGLTGKTVFTSPYHPGKLLGALGALLGVGLIVIGYAGVFLGRLIQAGVSRQREFLADAAAVQFTRNPAGLAGALKKIGRHGSQVKNPHAEETSHLFVADAVRPWRGGQTARRVRKATLWTAFLDLLSTHPPLEERLRWLDPSFDGTFSKVSRETRSEDDRARPRLATDQEQIVQSVRQRTIGKRAEAGRQSISFQPAEVVSRVGMPAPEHLTYAATLVSTLPQELVSVLHEPFGAVAVIYALLLDEDEDSRRAQLEVLAQHAEHSMHEETVRVLPMLSRLSPEARLPVVELVIPTLQNLSLNQYHSFRDNVGRLVNADQRISLFEYSLQRMLLDHLRPHFEKTGPRRVRYHRRIRRLLPYCVQLLSTLAYVGQADRAAAARAFARAADRLAPAGPKPQLLPREQSAFRAFDEALDLLSAASPQIKKRVLEACATCIGADGRATVEEAELLRVVANSLDCPMPPLLAIHAPAERAGLGQTQPGSSAPPFVAGRGLETGRSSTQQATSGMHAAAVSLVLCIVLLIVGGNGAIFYLSRGHALGRSAIDRLGGKYSHPDSYGLYYRIKVGPYVSVSFAEKPLADDELRRLAPLFPFLAPFHWLALDLSGTHVTDAGLDPLRGANNLRFLSLATTQVTDAGVAKLADCQNLEYLNLSSCGRVTDESLQTVGRLPRLRYLMIGRTGITDQGLAHLETLHKLRYLDLRETVITEAGLIRLREVLPALEIEY